MRPFRFETPLGLFSVVWGLGAALHYLEKEPLVGLPLYPFVLLLVIFPERVWALACFALADAALLASKLPALANHSLLSLLVDLCVLVGCAGAWRRPSLHLRRQLWQSVRGPIQATVVVVYFWAIFHKLNSSFFDPAVSCATSQVFKMLELHGVLRALSADPSAFALNIPLTLALELAILVLLLVPRLVPVGLVIGLVFHTALAWARFFDFATVILALYLFFVPWDVLERRIGRIAGWARATAACSLGILAATSFYYYGVREDPIILTGTDWSLRADTLMCLAWTIMIWPILLPIFAGGWTTGGDHRWQGARLAWVIPAIALANGATSYLGLKTVANFSMFSNLRTEGGRTNHYLVPAGRFFLAGYQNDLVRIERLDAQPPARWPLRIRLLGGGRRVYGNANWLEEVPGARVPLAELRRIVQFWRDAGLRNIEVGYERNGELHVSEDPYSDPVLVAPMPFWERRLMAYRAVQDDGQESACRW
jgi:hypothetical protein